jgi:molybdopterin-containing oxidoreductase family membrane subunit
MIAIKEKILFWILRPDLAQGEPFKRALWICGELLLLLGLFGFGDRFLYEHQHANYGNTVPWGLWVAAYIYFIGLSAGSFLISSLVYAFNFKQFEKIGRLALLMAVITLLLALLSIALDLGHLGRAWHVFVYPNFASPMAWMIWLYSAYMLVLLLELRYVLREDFAERASQPGLAGRIYRLLAGGSAFEPARFAKDREIVRRLAIAGIPVAILFHGGVGALFGVVAARPHWHSGMFPILFLLSALASGGALLILVSAIFQRGLDRNSDVVLALGKLVLGLLLLDVMFQISEYLVAFRGGIPGHIAGMKMVLGGDYWYVFWIWQLGIGTVAPVYLLASAHGRDPKKVALAGLLIAAGFFGLRLNIVIPGLAAEEIHGISRAFASARMSPEYFPSLTESLVLSGIVGLGLLLFGLGEMLLPTGEKKETGHV